MIVTKAKKIMKASIKYFCLFDLRDLGARLVFHHLASQVRADLLLYLFSSVSSLRLTEELEGPNRELVLLKLVESLFEGPRLTARGLKKNMYSSILKPFFIQ